MSAPISLADIKAEAKQISARAIAAGFFREPAEKLTTQQAYDRYHNQRNKDRMLRLVEDGLTMHGRPRKHRFSQRRSRLQLRTLDP